MTTETAVSTCRVCRSNNVKTFMSVPKVPVYCNVLWPDADAARAAPSGDLELGICDDCGHIFNYAFDPSLMDYTVEYENSLHFSARFQKYATWLSQHLVDSYDIRKKDVIDIGCGKGDFLAEVCATGNNRGWGFDRSYSPDQATHAANPNLRFFSEFFSDKHADTPADLVCCRHVLEHIDHPIEFLDQIRGIFLGWRNPVVFFEVPNVMYTLRDLGIWDLIYEHCSYFSPASLITAFSNAGFEVLDTIELYHGQFLGIECRLSDANSPDLAREVTLVRHHAETFADRYRAKVETWDSQLRQWEREGRRAVVWGGGSKGVTFLNILKPSAVDAVVDINPRKHGKHVVGTGQRIVPPEALCSDPPDIVIVMNPVYSEEIGKSLAALGLRAEIITP